MTTSVWKYWYFASMRRARSFQRVQQKKEVVGLPPVDVASTQPSTVTVDTTHNHVVMAACRPLRTYTDVAHGKAGVTNAATAPCDCRPISRSSYKVHVPVQYFCFLFWFPDLDIRVVPGVNCLQISAWSRKRKDVMPPVDAVRCVMFSPEWKC
jgi:hypothetical protein